MAQATNSRAVQAPYVLPKLPRIPPGIPRYKVMRKAMSASDSSTPVNLRLHPFIYDALDPDKIPTTQTPPEEAGRTAFEAAQAIGNLAGQPCRIIPGTVDTNIAALLFFWPRVWLWIETLAHSLDSYNESVASELARAITGTFSLVRLHIELQTPQAIAVVSRLWLLETKGHARVKSFRGYTSPTMLSFIVDHQGPASLKDHPVTDPAVIGVIASALGQDRDSLVSVARHRLRRTMSEYKDTQKNDEAPAYRIFMDSCVFWYLTRDHDGPLPYSKLKRAVQVAMDALHVMLSRPFREKTASQEAMAIRGFLLQIQRATGLPSGQHVIRHVFERQFIRTFALAVPWIQWELRQPPPPPGKVLESPPMIDLFERILCGHLIHRAVLEAVLGDIGAADPSCMERGLSSCTAARNLWVKFAAAVGEYGSILRGLDDQGRKKTCSGPLCGVVDNAECELKACTGCQKPAYCSQTCQRADWPSHREYCVKARALMSKGVMATTSERNMDFVVALVRHQLKKHRESVQAGIDSVPMEDVVVIQVDLRTAIAKVTAGLDKARFDDDSANRAVINVLYRRSDAEAAIQCYVSYAPTELATSGEDSPSTVSFEGTDELALQSGPRLLDLETVQFAETVGRDTLDPRSTNTPQSEKGCDERVEDPAE